MGLVESYSLSDYEVMNLELSADPLTLWIANTPNGRNSVKDIGKHICPHGVTQQNLCDVYRKSNQDTYISRQKQ